jgi:hypothetical protein
MDHKSTENLTHLKVSPYDNALGLSSEIAKEKIPKLALLLSRIPACLILGDAIQEIPTT